MNSKKRIKKIAGSIKNRVLMAALFLKYFLWRRALLVKWISLPDPVIFRGNSFTMRWEITGCYKIVVNGTIKLSGNTNMIQVDPVDLEGSLRLQFYGCGHIMERKYPVKNDVQPFRRNINVHLESNQLITSRLQQQSLCSTVGELDRMKNTFSVRPASIHFRPGLMALSSNNFRSLRIHFETFKNNTLTPNP